MLGHPNVLPLTTVELASSLGEWFVRITNQGASTVHSFERERPALAFAEKQRIRLGVDRIVVTEENTGGLSHRK